jgi:hypothetical protein
LSPISWSAHAPDVVSPGSRRKSKIVFNHGDSWYYSVCVCMYVCMVGCGLKQACTVYVSVLYMLILNLSQLQEHCRKFQQHRTNLLKVLYLICII